MFYFTCEQRKRSSEGSDEEKETPGKHEKKKSKKDKKKAKEKEKEEVKEKESSDEVSKQHVGHLKDSFYRTGFINIKIFQQQSNWFSQGGQISITQIRFPIGGKRITCRGSKLTDSLGKHVIRSCSLKPWQIYELAGVKQMISSQIFLVLSWEV